MLSFRFRFIKIVCFSVVSISQGSNFAKRLNLNNINGVTEKIRCLKLVLLINLFFK